MRLSALYRATRRPVFEGVKGGRHLTSEITKGALVRWNNGEQLRWGIVASVTNGGKSVAVHFDEGDDLSFAWPSETLERVLLEAGQPVRLIATDDRGVVTTRVTSNGRTFYSVALA